MGKECHRRIFNQSANITLKTRVAGELALHYMCSLQNPTLSAAASCIYSLKCFYCWNNVA